ncbi:MAG: GDSL-type esterase/lipase family protein [Planctomycetota bacterium]
MNRVPKKSTLPILSFLICFAFCEGLIEAQKPKPRRYPHGSYSEIQSDVPRGKITEYQFNDSEIYPGTKRRFYVYVPEQYDVSQEAALMVFQDGHAYVNPKGEYRATVVMDNLIHRNEMPITIGVFVDPGHLGDLPEKPGWRPRPANRSIEYDTPNSDYAKFLINEILPKVEADYKITEAPEGRAICGASSGGICAFTAAWEMPDQFGKVISHIGSFANIRGGDVYPGIIRKTDVKPIRIYLQDGSNDLDNEHGNWPLGNQQVYAALKFKGYDVRFDYGEGAHNGNHGGAVLPDAMRWLWRDYPGVSARLPIIPEIQTAKWAVNWWMPRHEAKLWERKLMEEVDLLMIGDSITHGWERKGKKTWDQYYANRNALNLGFSGDRTEHVLWRFQNGALDDINPKLAVIMIGTNNTGHRMDAPELIAEGVRRVVDELKLRLPETKVLLLGVFPRDAQADGKMRQNNDAVNQILKGYADNKNIWYLDIGDQFLDEEQVLPKSIMPDLLHPNEKGYAIWAEAMEPMMVQLLNE